MPMFQHGFHSRAIPDLFPSQTRPIARRVFRRRLLSERSGVTALEFGLVAPIFLFAVFAIFDFAFSLYSVVSLDTGLDMAARDVELGTIRTEADFRTSLCEHVSGFLTDCATKLVVRAASTGDPNGVAGLQPGDGFDIGNAGYFVLLRVGYPMPHVVSMLGGTHDMVATLFIQREPFPQ